MSLRESRSRHKTDDCKSTANASRDSRLQARRWTGLTVAGGFLAPSTLKLTNAWSEMIRRQANQRVQWQGRVCVQQCESADWRAADSQTIAAVGIDAQHGRAGTGQHECWSLRRRRRRIYKPQAAQAPTSALQRRPQSMVISLAVLMRLRETPASWPCHSRGL